jgi:hypothetical protein
MSRSVRAATALGVVAQPPTRGVYTTASAKGPTVGLRVERFLRARFAYGTRWRRRRGARRRHLRASRRGQDSTPRSPPAMFPANRFMPLSPIPESATACRKFATSSSSGAAEVKGHQNSTSVKPAAVARLRASRTGPVEDRAVQPVLSEIHLDSVGAITCPVSGPSQIRRPVLSDEPGMSRTDGSVADADEHSFAAWRGSIEAALTAGSPE